MIGRTTRRRLGLALALALASGCTALDVPATIGTPTPAAPAVPALDARDQYALLADVERARGHGLTADPAALAAVRSDWQGRRVRWELAWLDALCPADGPGACTLLPFDHGRRPDRIVQGWLPRLAVDAALRREIGRRCAAVEGVCVVQVDATLDRLVLSNDEPTSLQLGAVTVRGARASTADESWIGRRPQRRAHAARRPVAPPSTRSRNG